MVLSFYGPRSLLVNQSFHDSCDIQSHALVPWSISVDSSNSYLILDFGSTQPSSDTDYLELVQAPQVQGRALHRTALPLDDSHRGVPGPPKLLPNCPMWGFHDSFRFDNSPEWLIELMKMLYLLQLYLKGYNSRRAKWGEPRTELSLCAFSPWTERECVTL